MAIEMTRNEIKRLYRNVYCVGYCDMYYLLQDGARKIGYNSGVYGWNYTVYEINADTCILTGYRGFFGKKIPHKAWKVLEENLKTYKTKNVSYKQVEKRAKSSLDKVIKKMERM